MMNEDPKFIRMRCACGKALRIPQEYAGRKARCPACGKPFEIPSQGPAAASAEGPASSAPDIVGSDASDLVSSELRRRSGGPASGSFAVVLAEPQAEVQATISALADVLVRTMGVAKPDATRTVRQAHGILLSDVDMETARRVCGAIHACGQKAAYIDAAALASMGRPREIHMAGCDARRFWAQIGLTGKQEFAWPDVRLLSLVLYHEPDRLIVRPPAAARRTRFGTGLRARPLAAFGVLGGAALAGIVERARQARAHMAQDLRHRGAGEHMYVADIFISQPRMVLRITNKRFNYSYLGDRLEGVSELNFHCLLADIALWAKVVVFSPLAQRFLQGDLLRDSVVSDLSDFDKYNRWLHFSAAAFGNWGAS